MGSAAHASVRLVFTSLVTKLSLVPLLALVASTACFPSSEPGRFVIHGVVTDAATGAMLADVEVSLLGERSQTVKTDEAGYFAFRELTAAHHALVRYTREGYEVTTFRVELEDPLLGQPTNELPTDPNGKPVEKREPAGPVLVDASRALTPVAKPQQPRRTLEVSGWVYGAGLPATDAQVLLLDVKTERYVHEQRTDAAGRFSFQNVAAGRYLLRVWPFDRDGNGIADFRLYTLDLGELESGSFNLTNLAIHLDDAAADLQAAAFLDPSTRGAGRPAGYPITPNELRDGVTARLPPGRRIFLHWGSEVETESAAFSLRERAPGGGVGSVLPLNATWQTNHVVVELTPTVPLITDGSGGTGYVLSIDSLRLKDGTVLFTPAAAGTLSFDVWERTQPLENPIPSLYFANLGEPNRPAEQVVFDAGGAWLLDEAGDVLRAFEPSQHWTDETGLQLTWPHVTGAAGYRVYARNTLPFDSTGSTHRPWRLVAANFTSALDIREPPVVEEENDEEPSEDDEGDEEDGEAGDGSEETAPVARTVIFASGVMKREFQFFGPPGTGLPWLFGNGVELAVTTVHPDGFESPLDPQKTLTVADATPPSIVAVNGDYDGAGSLGRTVEAGARLRRNLLVEFSEPMNGAAAPVLTARSGNVSIESVLPASWSATRPNIPVELSNAVAIPVVLRARGLCTEVTVDRVGYPSGDPRPGDTVLVVADAAALRAGADHRVIFVSPGGDFIGEVRNVVSSNALTGQVSLANPLTVDVPAGSLACLASTTPGNVATLTAFTNLVDEPVVDDPPGEEEDEDEPESGVALLTVNDASIFHRGQQVIVFHPRQGETPESYDLRTVTHVDTVQRHVRVDALVSSGHVANASVVMPFQFVPEYRLRSAEALELRADVAGNANVEIQLTGNGALEVMKGDRVLFDADGSRLTTADRVETTVKEVRFVAATESTPESFRIAVDLPTGTHFVRGVASVVALGDSFELAGVQDTSQQLPTDGLDLRRDAFSFEDADAEVSFVY